MGKYTITEFAKLCGTSPATISRVFNNPELVAPQTRKHVEQKMKEFGYKPNPFASRLSSKSSWGLALFVFDILNPFFALIVRNISHLAMEQGIPLTVCDTENNEQKEKIYLDYLLDNKIAGVIFTEGISLATIERSRKYTETVLIDRHVQEGVVSEVSSDNYSGGRQATEYLLQLNHRRIGFISGPVNWPSVEERFRGYKDALESYGVPFDPELVYEGDLQYESGIRALEYFLTLPEWPTAVFSANDQMAYGAMSKANNLNIAIPDDLSMIGFDDIPFYSFYQANLTTIKQDIPRLCEESFSLLMTKLKNGDSSAAEKRIIVPTRLKIGETCRKLVGSINTAARRGQER